MELYSKAIVGNQDSQHVFMARQASHVSRLHTEEVEPVGRCPIAETNNEQLAQWLGDAINDTLNDRPCHERPEGGFERVGHFTPKGLSVCSWDIENQRPGFEVARGEHEHAANALADRLNDLLQ